MNIEKVFYVAGNFAHQGACASVRKFESIILVAEPDNIHDSNAIKVSSKYGKKLGYVPASKCKGFHKLFSTHPYHCARVRDVKGGRGYDYLPQIEVYFAKSESDLPFSPQIKPQIRYSFWAGLLGIINLILYFFLNNGN
jgi:hypothetical protein